MLNDVGDRPAAATSEVGGAIGTRADGGARREEPYRCASSSLIPRK
jgi:hypothetical protein